MRGLQGKIAIVTGAGMGQGRSTALRLASEGVHVLAADMDGDSVAKTAAESPEQIESMVVDVTKRDEVEGLVQAAADRHGRLDILCNVVGVAGLAQALIPDVDYDEYDRLMEINLRSAFYSMKHAIPLMVTSGGGSIVNWSSVGALAAVPTTGIYGASKAGIIALTKAAAREWGKDNIRVNAIAPGFIYPTGMTLMGMEKYPETAQHTAEKAALQRPGHPDEIAAVAAFLASDEASFVSGSTIVVDGAKICGQ